MRAGLAKKQGLLPKLSSPKKGDFVSKSHEVGDMTKAAKKMTDLWRSYGEGGS